MNIARLVKTEKIYVFMLQDKKRPKWYYSSWCDVSESPEWTTRSITLVEPDHERLKKIGYPDLRGRMTKMQAEKHFNELLKCSNEVEFVKS